MSSNSQEVNVIRDGRYSQVTNVSGRAVSRRSILWTWIVSILFFFFYAFAVFAALGNLIGVTQIANVLGANISFVGWIVLIIGIVFPPIIFGLGVWLGRKRSVLSRALVLLAGLGLVAIVMINTLQSIRLGTFFI
ncbi:hypothetical protein [Lysinibacter sp. HNR]|uniref:hypothetical protein n=1 Tax=Lysinibacter sp. HNR TaxID=3031408 RepID=UPI002434C9E9|nr:hypothetical protein [Lysinibacter sp. HNR]WGD38253.1 hypothetical protein FrondiHNR_04880 [Lysinibacter sp. HNR]